MTPTAFIKEYIGLLVILAIPTCTIFVLAIAGLTAWLTYKFNLNDKLQITVIIIAFIVGFAGFFYLTAKLFDHFNYGQVVRIFVLESAGEKRVLVWTDLEDRGGNISTVWANRFKLYDLKTGKLIHQSFLNRFAELRDYSIYGPFLDGRAWGYSRQTGLSLLDLYEAKVLLNEKQILKQLPKLGKTIRSFSGDEYDSRTDTFYVTTPDGKVHGINPNDLGRLVRKVNWLSNKKHWKRLKQILPRDLAVQLQ